MVFLRGTLVSLALSASAQCAGESQLPLPSAEWSDSEFRFSGLSWRARKAGIRAGPGNNFWNASSPNVRVDDAGYLHLRIDFVDDAWRSAEVSTPLPDAPCRVHVTIGSPLTPLPAGVILGVFAYRSDASEFDFEAGPWDSKDDTDGHFTVQPASIPGHQYAFHLSSHEVNELTVDWRRGRIGFRLTTPSEEDEERWEYIGEDAPEPRGHRLHMNLWLLQGNPERAVPIDIAVRRVEIIPLASLSVGAPHVHPIPEGHGLSAKGVLRGLSNTETR